MKCSSTRVPVCWFVFNSIAIIHSLDVYGHDPMWLGLQSVEVFSFKVLQDEIVLSPSRLKSVFVYAQYNYIWYSGLFCLLTTEFSQQEKQ